MHNTKRSDSPLLNKSEAAEYLRRSTRTLDRLVVDGEIRVTRVRGGVLFTRQELDRFIAANTASVTEHSGAAVLATA